MADEQNPELAGGFHVDRSESVREKKTTSYSPAEMWFDKLRSWTWPSRYYLCVCLWVCLCVCADNLLGQVYQISDPPFRSDNLPEAIFLSASRLSKITLLLN